MKYYTGKFRWSDIDANRHIRNTAYNDLFIEARMAKLKEHGFGQKKMKELGMGPMVIHEHLYYVKEFTSDGEFFIDIQLKASSKDYRFNRFVQHLFNAKGELCCYLDITLAILDLKARKIAPPSPELLDTLNSLPKVEDFHIIDSSALKMEGVPYGLKIDPELFHKE